jgi:outer membrane protein TolC
MVRACARRLLIAAAAVSCLSMLPVYALGLPEPAPQDAITIDLKAALERARVNSEPLQSAALDVELAREDRTQARSALLPSLSSFNQYRYTQGNGTSSGVFVSDDGVHVYTSQAQVHQELFSPERLGEFRRATAAQALFSARRDIVERGLVATVVQSYYEAVAAQRRLANAGRGLDEAVRFLEITRKLEQGGEVAHADVLKAQLVQQQREREVQDARYQSEKARIGLSVLIFPDYRLDFSLVDDLNAINPLPPYGDLETLAMGKSPELRAAEESVRQGTFGIEIARSAYFPSLSFDYFYGINANQFAVNSDGTRNLGSAAQATLSIPIWDWWTTRSKVRQADMRRKQAQLDLDFSRKQLISHLHSLYLDAESMLSQLDSLHRSLEGATESLRLTSLRYEAGEVSVLEVVDAQATLTGARNAYDDGLWRYRLALATLQTLTGTM